MRCLCVLIHLNFLFNSKYVVHFFQEGSITQVACCPHDEDFIAVATRLAPVPEAKICLILIFPPV